MGVLEYLGSYRTEGALPLTIDMDAVAAAYGLADNDVVVMCCRSVVPIPAGYVGTLPAAVMPSGPTLSISPGGSITFRQSTWASGLVTPAWLLRQQPQGYQYSPEFMHSLVFVGPGAIGTPAIPESDIYVLVTLTFVRSPRVVPGVNVGYTGYHLPRFTQVTSLIGSTGDEVVTRAVDYVGTTGPGDITDAVLFCCWNADRYGLVSPDESRATDLLDTARWTHPAGFALPTTNDRAFGMEVVYAHANVSPILGLGPGPVDHDFDTGFNPAIGYSGTHYWSGEFEGKVGPLLAAASTHTKQWMGVAAVFWPQPATSGPPASEGRWEVRLD